jgi:hypothetical protein
MRWALQNPRDLGRMRARLDFRTVLRLQTSNRRKRDTQYCRGGIGNEENLALSDRCPWEMISTGQIQKGLEAVLDVASVQREETTKTKGEGDQELTGSRRGQSGLPRSWISKLTTRQLRPIGRSNRQVFLLTDTLAKRSTWRKTKQYRYQTARSILGCHAHISFRAMQQWVKFLCGPNPSKNKKLDNS